MTTTHTNLALVEGEILIMANSPHLSIPRMNITGTSIIASTKKMEGVILLDRKHFVKPKVDVEELATELSNNFHYEMEKASFYEGFIDGYNAKEAEFTREEMIQAISAARIISKGGKPKYTREEILNLIYPLSLPKSITTDENCNVISVTW